MCVPLACPQQMGSSTGAGRYTSSCAGVGHTTMLPLCRVPTRAQANVSHTCIVASSGGMWGRHTVKPMVGVGPTCRPPWCACESHVLMFALYLASNTWQKGFFIVCLRMTHGKKVALSCTGTNTRQDVCCVSDIWHTANYGFAVPLTVV
jgi:hypothetical protein